MRAYTRQSFVAVALLLASSLAAAKEPIPESGPEVVTLASPGSPLVAVRLMFRTGSIDDPLGKEGLSALTALMVGSAGTAKRSFKELSEALYPMAAYIDVATVREVTVFSGEVHRDNLANYTAILTEALLEPGFAETDLERNREKLISYLTATLRSGSDELLGLEALDDVLCQDHPYGHPSEGTIEGLRNITMEDVRQFYAGHYTKARLMVGVAGGYPEGYVGELTAKLEALPVGRESITSISQATPVEGRRFTLIDKRTGSVGIQLGYPIPVTRTDPDYYALLVANSYLGEHRTFHGKLMQQLRSLRGLNYGDYSYAEHWANPPGTSNPTPNRVRRVQAFTVWIRPVAPENARFALRAALHFLDEARDKGISEADFTATRDFLVGYSKLWAQSLSRRLGFLMDSKFYGAPPYIEEIERSLSALTRDQVNAALRKYIRTDAYQAVIVTDNASALKDALEADAPSPIKYNSEVAPEVLEADKAIVGRKIAPTEVRIVPAGEMFER